MLAVRRHQVLALLHEVRPDDFALCRNVEAMCHAAARSATDYHDHVRHALYNLHENSHVGEEVLYASNETLTTGTLTGRIREETRLRTERFHQMLQEKYDALNDRTFAAIVRCRRCGSEEVTWEEKQTRSADEGASLYCACSVCKNRWVIR